MSWMRRTWSPLSLLRNSMAAASASIMLLSRAMIASAMRSGSALPLRRRASARAMRIFAVVAEKGAAITSSSPNAKARSSSASSASPSRKTAQPPSCAKSRFSRAKSCAAKSAASQTAASGFSASASDVTTR